MFGAKPDSKWLPQPIHLSLHQNGYTSVKCTHIGLKCKGVVGESHDQHTLSTNVMVKV